MTVFEEVGREMAVTFGPILLAILAFGAFRIWQVFIRGNRKQRRGTTSSVGAERRHLPLKGKALEGGARR